MKCRAKPGTLSLSRSIHTRDVLYYLTLSYFFLLASVRSLDAQRWD